MEVVIVCDKESMMLSRWPESQTVITRCIHVHPHEVKQGARL